MTLTPTRVDQLRLVHAVYYAHHDAQRDGRDGEALRWRMAAAEGRIKVRKIRNQHAVRVEIVDAQKGGDHVGR